MRAIAWLSLLFVSCAGASPALETSPSSGPGVVAEASAQEGSLDPPPPRRTPSSAKPSAAPASKGGEPTAPTPPVDPDVALAEVPYLSAFEKEVLVLSNRLRRDPVAYAERLARFARAYEGKVLRLPGQPPLLTIEGHTAAQEAVRALKRASPAPPLEPSRGMTQAARAHAQDIGEKGITSHQGTDGSSTFDRLDRYGEWLTAAAENLHYGARSPEEVVHLLLVDDGVPGRGHRTNMLNPKFRRAGVACAPHATWRRVCVITYAAGYKER